VKQPYFGYERATLGWAHHTSMWKGWLPYLPPDLGGDNSKQRRQQVEIAGRKLLSRIIEVSVSVPDRVQ